MEDQPLDSMVPPQKRKKFPRVLLVIIAGGSLVLIAVIVDLIKLFGIYGCAAKNFSHSCSSNLHTTELITRFSAVFIYVGMTLIVVGIVILILQEIIKNKKSNPHNS